MKKLVIYDNECFNVVDIISQKLDFEKNEDIKFCGIEKLDFEQLSNENFDKVFYFANEKLCFVSAKLLDFLSELEYKKISLKIDLIFFFETENSTSLVQTWCDNLKILRQNVNLSLKLKLSNWKTYSDVLLKILKDENFSERTGNLESLQGLNSQNQMVFQNDLKNELQELSSNVETKGELCKKSTCKNFVTIYTDGACSGNPGAGGWGAVLIAGERRKEISGFDPLTTNNKMELTAVIKALSMLKQQCDVELYSDSAYVVNAINQNWLENWKKNNFVGSDKKPVKNIELWKALDELLSYHNVHFNKVKGHADNELNNRCDALATSEIATHTQND